MKTTTTKLSWLTVDDHAAAFARLALDGMTDPRERRRVYQRTVKFQKKALVKILRRRQAEALKIVRSELGFETLDAQRADALDFREASVASLRCMLQRGGVAETPAVLAHLGVETLDERGRDGLDFHEVAIWTVRAVMLGEVC